jgi:hypothetical protein
MRSRLGFRWAGTVATIMLAAAVMGTFITTVPRYRERAVQVFVIFAGALVIRLVVREIVASSSRPGPFAFDRALVPPPVTELGPASEPARIRFEVGAATHRAMELHHQLRRRLRALAADRLDARHGVDPDGDPDAAARLLGEDAWELLRPDREAPQDRFGPGLPVETVARIVGAVEDL